MRGGSTMRQNGKKAHAGRRGRRWMKRAKEGNRPGEATDSRRQEPERPNDRDE